MIHATLCFIFDADCCLMLKRQRPPHAGEWNAPGGKVRPGETAEQACRREVAEETGITLSAINNMGTIDCFDKLDADNTWCLHLFLATSQRVSVPPHSEGEFAWLPLSRLLLDQDVVHNIPLFLPLLIQGYGVKGKFFYLGDDLQKYSIDLIRAIS